MKLASVHHVFFQENRIFLAFSILSDNGFLFMLLFDVKFETSEQEMRQSQNVHFLYRTHVRTKKKPRKTYKNKYIVTIQQPDL